MVNNLWVVLKRIDKVIDSCVDKKQLRMAHRYCILLSEKHVEQKMKEATKVIYEVHYGYLKYRMEEYIDDKTIDKMDELSN